MKSRLIPTLWAVGCVGAILWTCFWTFGVIHTGKINAAVVILIALGIWGLWGGARAVRQARSK
jgi:hypothetical protein